MPDSHRLPSPLTYVWTPDGNTGPRQRPAADRRTGGAYNRRVALDRLVLWAPVILWAGVIFVLSSIPNLGTDLGTWDLVARKIAHALEFGVLGALLFRALERPAVAVALGSLYAATDEVHQSFVDGRVGSPLDWTIDTVGVVLGVLLLARRR